MKRIKILDVYDIYKVYATTQNDKALESLGGIRRAVFNAVYLILKKGS